MKPNPLSFSALDTPQALAIDQLPTPLLRKHSEQSPKPQMGKTLLLASRRCPILHFEKTSASIKLTKPLAIASTDSSMAGLRTEPSDIKGVATSSILICPSRCLLPLLPRCLLPVAVQVVALVVMHPKALPQHHALPLPLPLPLPLHIITINPHHQQPQHQL